MDKKKRAKVKEEKTKKWKAKKNLKLFSLKC
jgi:hypothetical protein